MKKYFLKICLLMLIMLVVGQSYAQEWKRELFFRNISTDQGLSNTTIMCIHEDAMGFIWFGTNEGLNRYDGNEFKYFLHDLSDSNSIAGNRIVAILEDEQYNLWIGTNNGLSRYNYRTDVLTNFRSADGENLIMDLAFDEKNKRIWMANWTGGLRYLDLESGVVISYSNESMKNALPIKLLIIDEELFIGTSNNGVYEINLESFRTREFCNTNSGLFRIPSNDINDLHHFGENLLIATDGGGLIRHYFKDNIQYYYDTKNSLIPSSNITSIANDSNGIIYIGSKNGLAVFNDQEEFISFHQHIEGNPNSLTSNEINTLFVGENRELWVGTSQDGVDFRSIESKNTTLIRKNLSNTNSLSGNNIMCFAEDKNGGIWIGTRLDGLNYYLDGKYTHFKADGSKNSISGNSITDICIDKNETVWISTIDNGLNKFENGKFTQHLHYEKDPISLLSNRIRKMEIDQSGTLWLGTSLGMASFDTKNEVFKHYHLDNTNSELSTKSNVRTFTIDRKGNICVGTSVGFFIFDPLTGHSKAYEKDPDNPNTFGHSVIYEILEDSKGDLWFATLGWGLIQFDRQSNAFKSYNHLNGFPDKIIKSIEEDKNGNLWIGSSKGIIKFTPSTEKSELYSELYGLQGQLFNRKASLLCGDGQMIFGGTNGFNVFRPESLESVKPKMEVVITDLELTDQPVAVLGQADILKQDISFVQSVRIPYDYSKHFTISFSAQNYSYPNEVQYAYKLEGFEDEWKYIGNEHRVSFTNLEPGDYVFHVMSSNNGGWDNEVRTLNIRISTPWYMTILFRISLGILLIFLIVAFYFYKEHLHVKRQLILERLVDEKNYEINSQNEELVASNEELYVQHEEVVRQKEQIDHKNKALNMAHAELTNAHSELTKVNNSLEERVASRTRQLKESNIKLGKTVMELDRFVYSASHDLSAPLKSVLGLVNIAKLESKEKNLEIHLNYIEQSIKKQEKVIKSLIQYSRNSRQSIAIAPLYLSGLIDEVISELMYMPGSEDVGLINMIPEDIVINSDEQRLQTILNNLLSNGINYRAKNRNDAFVKIHFIRNTKSWQLKVMDNGLGIEDDQQEKIFEMFHRANEESDGSGLGLFIVKEAAEKLGGKISLNSALEVGSEFTLEFPVL